MGDDLKIEISQAEGVRCPRCHKYHRVEMNFEHLCDRCQDVIVQGYPDHPAVVGIKAALAEQRKKWGI